MDGKLDGLKYWRCKNGHLLGVVGRRQVVMSGVRFHTPLLMIFRMAIDLAVAKMDSADVAGELYGRMLLGFRWRCSVAGCGCAREWHPEEDALDWLFRRYGKVTPPPAPPQTRSTFGEGRKEGA
jgi:hypothetical protein